MIDKDKKYTTRNGREVRIYATDCGGLYPVHGAILYDGLWVINSWPLDGMDAIDSISNADLIEVKPRKKIERWVAIDSGGNASMYLSNPPPVVMMSAFAIKHIVFEVEEGEGLDAVSMLRKTTNALLYQKR